MIVAKLTDTDDGTASGYHPSSHRREVRDVRTLHTPPPTHGRLIFHSHVTDDRLTPHQNVLHPVTRRARPCCRVGGAAWNR